MRTTHRMPARCSRLIERAELHSYLVGTTELFRRTF